jgi:hypothetical protein
MPLSHSQIRVVIIVGFALSALGSIFTYLNDITSIGGGFGSGRLVLDELLAILSPIAAAVAWWFLSQLEARDSNGLKLLRRAYLFFAVQYLLIAAGYNFVFTPIRYFGGVWITTALWLEFFGPLVAALGLFLMSRSLVTLDEVSQPQSEVGESVSSA